jgi:hypothetical protein
MHSELERQLDGVKKCEPWEHLLADAGPHDHIVQLYQHQDFLNSAGCRFVGAGGESSKLNRTYNGWCHISSSGPHGLDLVQLTYEQVVHNQIPHVYAS